MCSKAILVVNLARLGRPRVHQERPKSGQVRAKSGQERAKSGPRAAKSRPRAAKSSPRAAQNRPGAVQERPRAAQEQPKSGPIATQRGPRAVQRLSWSHLGSFWDASGGQNHGFNLVGSQSFSPPTSKSPTVHNMHGYTLVYIHEWLHKPSMKGSSCELPTIVKPMGLLWFCTSTSPKGSFASPVLGPGEACETL